MNLTIIIIFTIVLSLIGMSAMVYMWARNRGFIKLDYFANISDEHNEYLAGHPTYSVDPYVPQAASGDLGHPKLHGWAPDDANEVEYELVDNPIMYS